MNITDFLTKRRPPGHARSKLTLDVRDHIAEQWALTGHRKYILSNLKAGIEVPDTIKDGVTRGYRLDGDSLVLTAVSKLPNRELEATGNSDTFPKIEGSISVLLSWLSTEHRDYRPYTTALIDEAERAGFLTVYYATLERLAL